MTIEIVKAEQENIDLVYGMICDLEKSNLDFESFKQTYLDNLKDSDILYRMIRLQNQTVGFISIHFQKLLHHAQIVAEIQEFYILPLYRNKGIGGEVLKILGANLSDQKVKLLEVSTNIIREKTHLFYKKNSFQESHVKFTRKEV